MEGGCHAEPKPSDATISAIFTHFHDNAGISGDGTKRAANTCISSRQMVTRVSQIHTLTQYKGDCHGGSILIRYSYTKGPCASIWGKAGGSVTSLGASLPNSASGEFSSAIGEGYEDGANGSDEFDNPPPKHCSDSTPEEKSCSAYKKHWKGKYCRWARDPKTSRRRQQVRRRAWAGDALDHCKKTCGVCCSDGTPKSKAAKRTCSTYATKWAGRYCRIARDPKQQARRRLWAGDARDHCRATCGICVGPLPKPRTHVATVVFQLKVSGNTWSGFGFAPITDRGALKSCKTSTDLSECVKKFFASHVPGMAAGSWPPSELPARARKASTDNKMVWRESNPVASKAYCDKHQPSMSIKRYLVDCLTKKPNWKGSMRVYGSKKCKNLQKYSQCPRGATVCELIDETNFALGIKYCPEETGANRCRTDCMRLATSCQGPDCMKAAANNWRCMDKTARGTTCQPVTRYIQVCQKACESSEMVSAHGETKFLKGAPLWLTESMFIKRVNSWDYTSASGQVVRIKGKRMAAGMVIWYYVDGIKVIHCGRHGSLAGRLKCRTKKKISVSTICTRVEAGCAQPSCNLSGAYSTPLERRDRRNRRLGLIQMVQPMICCQKHQKGCLQRIKKNLVANGSGHLMDTKQWVNLAANEALTV